MIVSSRIRIDISKWAFIIWYIYIYISIALEHYKRKSEKKLLAHVKDELLDSLVSIDKTNETGLDFC